MRQRCHLVCFELNSSKTVLVSPNYYLQAYPELPCRRK
jgi:hypothetical protein